MTMMSWDWGIYRWDLWVHVEVDKVDGEAQIYLMHTPLFDFIYMIMIFNK